MFIGATNAFGPLNLTFEVMENTIDQVVAGHASQLEVVLHPDSSIEVIDDGAGLDLQDPVVRSYFTEWHDTPTADGHTPHIHLQDFGLGLFMVNALSSRLICESACDGVPSRAEWVASELIGVSGADRLRGTSVRIWPDDQIFEPAAYLEDKLVERLNEYAALTPSLEVRFGDRVWPVETAAQGLARLLPANRPFAGPAYLKGTSREGTEESASLACVFSPAFEPGRGQFSCFVNYRNVNVPCKLRDQVRQNFREAILSSDSASHEGKPVTFEDLDIVLSMTMLGATFSGPTRAAVNDAVVVEAATSIIRKHVAESLATLFT